MSNLSVEVKCSKAASYHACGYYYNRSQLIVIIVLRKR